MIKEKMTDLPLNAPHTPKAYSNPQVWVRRFGIPLLLTLLLAVSFFSAVSAAPLPQATPTPHIVISEFRFTGSAGAGDEFVEIFNHTAANVDISSWRIRGSSNTGAIANRYLFPPATIIQPGQHYLITGTTFDDGVASDGALSAIGIANDGGVALTRNDNTVVDAVGLSTNAAAAFSGAVELAALPNGTDQSYERLPGGAYGSCYDTDNSSDFQVIAIADPQESSIVYDPCSVSLLYTPTFTLTPTATRTATNTPTASSTRTVTLTPTITSTFTRTLTPSSTATITETGLPGATSTPTLTRTLTPTFTTTPPLLKVIINEVAWSGTIANRFDEWIELYNPGSVVIDLNGWILTNPGTGFSVPLTGNIFGNDYYLLERSDDDTIRDITADQIYTGNMKDSDDYWILNDNNGNQIDTANINRDDWPAGSGAPDRCSMERNSATAADNDLGWFTNNNSTRIAHDAAGNSICGSPGDPNWAYNVTATPQPTETATRTRTPTTGPSPTRTATRSRTPTSSRTPTITITPTITLSPTITETPSLTRTSTITRTPTKTQTTTPVPLPVSSVVINEFLIQPRYDWNGDGKVDWGDAFIEIKNLSSESLSVGGWYLDDQEGDSSPFYLPSLSLEPGARKVYFASETNIILSERSDSVRLFKPGAISDVYTYTGVKLPNISWCRLPDEADLTHNAWVFGCEPTPETQNKLAQTIPVTRNDNELAICLSKTILQVVYDAECMSYGLAVWSPVYWSDALQSEYPLYIQRDDFIDIVE